MKELFLLDPAITFLNFGSFGACPKVIFDDYIHWERLLESEPVQFIAFDGYTYVRESIRKLAEFIQADPENIVFVPNPTHAINLIAKNLKLEPGDEILSTNLEYGAMDRTWNYYCNQQGATYVRQEIHLPIESKEAILADFEKGFSEKTKAVFFGQITSSTALILPVNEMLEMAKSRGIMTIVDGAHVPGHVPLNIRSLDPDFYTGTCHKWLMTPKGSSFLYTKTEMQEMLDPLIISWGYDSVNPSGSRYFDYHQFNGTRDFSAYLTIPKALEFRENYNWEQVAEACRKLVLEKAPEILEVLGTQPIAPLTDEFYGQMFSAEVQTEKPVELQRTLFEKYHIEIPVMEHNGHFYMRYSIQGFNTAEELDRLLEVLRELRKNTDLIH